MTRNWSSAALGAMVIAGGLGLVTAWARPGQAQPTPPLLAEPRPDPVLLVPVATASTSMRAVGTLSVQGFYADTPGATPTVMGRLMLWDDTGAASQFRVAFSVAPDKTRPGTFVFSTVLQTSELLGDSPGFRSGRLTLDCTNCGRGAFLTAGVYVEETSAVPLFAPYIAGLAEPRPDPIFQVF